MAPTETSDGIFTYQGSPDLVVVVIKLNAYENMVTYLRIKHLERVKEDKGEGLNMIMG